MDSQFRCARGSAVAALAAAAACAAACGPISGPSTLSSPRVKVLETGPIRIDRIYTSMAGPFNRVQMDPSDLDWVTGFRTEVVDVETGEALAEEFFCHSQIQLPNSTRLLVTATGTNEVRFPPGFGMPVRRILEGLPAEQRGLSLLGMVLNNHNPTMDRLAKIRGTIEYYRDDDVGKPPRLRKLYKVGLTLEVDELPGADPAARPATDEHGVSTHCATVGGVPSHWFVPPGPQLTRRRYRDFLPVNARVHYGLAHLHNYGKYVLLRDVSTGQVLWRTDAEYEPERVQIAKIPAYSSADGFPMYADREYEIEAFYENTSDRPVDAMAQVDLYYWPDGNVDITYPTAPH